MLRASGECLSISPVAGMVEVCGYRLFISLTKGGYKHGITLRSYLNVGEPDLLHVALGAIKMLIRSVYLCRTSCTAFIVGAGAAAAYESRLGNYLARTPRRVQTAGAGAEVIDKRTFH